MEPTEFFPSLVLLLGLLTVVSVFLRRWFQVFQRWRRGEPVAVLEGPLGVVPWGFVDLLALALLLITFQAGAAVLVGRRYNLDALTGLDELPIEPQLMLVAGLAVASLLWTLIALAATIFLRRASWRELGWDWTRWRADVRLGAVAFCMLAPIVYGIQAVLVRYWPSHHPMIEMIRENPQPMLVALGGIAASIAAPISEEIAFRLFLQGWMHNGLLLVLGHRRSESRDKAVLSAEPAPDGRDKLVLGINPQERLVLNRATMLEDSQPPSQAFTATEEERAAERRGPDEGHEARVLDAQLGALNPYAPPQASSESEESVYVDAEHAEAASLSPPRVLWSPILASAIIFALLHYSHGPDWVPLTVLAVGLGYLYQRTQRILPCIVVHMLLNSLSFGMLLVQLLTDLPAPK